VTKGLPLSIPFELVRHYFGGPEKRCPVASGSNVLESEGQQKGRVHMKFRVILALAIQFGLSAMAADHEKEVALALSACPALVASGAGVYVLEKSGYVKVRESKNGFTAIVQHSMPTSQ
jgi:hypothetical protein